MDALGASTFDLIDFFLAVVQVAYHRWFALPFMFCLTDLLLHCLVSLLHKRASYSCALQVCG